MFHGVGGQFVNDHGERCCSPFPNAHPSDSYANAAREGGRFVIGREQDRQQVAQERSLALLPRQRAHDVVSTAQGRQALRQLACHVRYG